MPSRERATCGGCGLACTGIEVVDGTTFEGACGLGEEWFAERLEPQPPLARVDGGETGLDAALDAAAELLAAARAPLICGLTQTTIEAQRAALDIADAIGATVDSGASTLAFQELGASTATLGELSRATLTVIWRADPATTHPRLKLHGEVVTVDPPGSLDPAESVGAHDEVARLDPPDSVGARGEVVRLDPREPIDALWTLRALVRGVAVTNDSPELAALAERLRASPHTALLHDARDHLEALGLHALVLDLAPRGHIVTLRLRRDVNAAGAEDVLAWRTGHADGPSGGEFDAIMAVGPAGQRPTISVGPRPSEDARVAIATAAAGVHRAGFVHRLDGVPVPLYAPLPSDRPGDDEVLEALAGRLT
jgi:formylmethanofuran dehydrogenase subunit B